MKKTIFLIAVILTIGTTVFCQNDYKTNLSKVDKQSNTTNNIIKYYFTSMQADSTVISRDTIKLVKNIINKDFPRFEFRNDSKFSFFYDSHLEIRKVKDAYTGELSEIVAPKYKKIQGTWETSDLQKGISLTLNNKKSINYSIIEEDNFIYFIRMK